MEALWVEAKGTVSRSELMLLLRPQGAGRISHVGVEESEHS